MLLKTGGENTAPKEKENSFFSHVVFKEKEDSSTTSEESSSIESSSSSASPTDDCVFAEDLSGSLKSKNEMIYLKKRNTFLEKQLKAMNRNMLVAETKKLEMLNRCNYLEAQVVKNSDNARHIKKLRAEFMTMHQKKAEVELDFMNQLNTLSMLMRQKELNHERILSEKDDMIFFLKTKLAAYKIMGCSDESKTCLGNDRNVVEQMQDVDISRDKESIAYLTSALTQSREKNTELSKEIKILQELVNKLEMKASQVSRIESELEDSRTTLNTFKRANALLSSLDKQHEQRLRQELLNSKREEEQFMSQLHALESDMSAELKDLQVSLSDENNACNNDQM